MDATDLRSDNKAPEPEIRLGDNVQKLWTVKKKLGAGACGTVWLLENNKNSKVHAAMKVEPFMRSPDDEILKMEVFVLKKMQRSKYVCRLYGAGKMKNFNFMIMSLLGRSIGDLRYLMPKKRFTTGTALRIAIQGTEGLRDLHEMGFIHRDVKPLNFSLGATVTTHRTVFLFDFGLARQILLPVQGKKELKLREKRKKVTFRGTVRYCSLNVHNRMEQGRHDDLFSLLYMTVELITGELPWRGLSRKESASVKQTIPDSKLFSKCPPNFSELHKYLKGLVYENVPNYDLVIQKFSDTLKTKKITKETPFDWEKGGRYFDAAQGKIMTAKRHKAVHDERLEKDPDVTSTVIEECPSTVEESGQSSGVAESEFDQENTLENLQPI